MKKVLAYFLISINLFAQTVLVDNVFSIESNCDQVLQKSGFTICYDYTTKNAKWVGYELTRDEVIKKNKRVDSFQEDTEIPRRYRATLYDYKRSGYDRGHLAPNADLDYSKESQEETFLLSNIVPQNSELNRIGWNELEGYVRGLSYKYGSVYVVSGTVPGANTIGVNKITIPDQLYKVIYIPKIDKSIAFLVFNVNIDRKNVFLNNVAVRKIEELIGVSFFKEIDIKAKYNSALIQ